MKQLLSIAAAAAICLSAVRITALPASAEEYAAPVDYWAPKSFSQALEFNNQYGAVCIENDVLCLVFRESTNSAYSYEVEPTADVISEISHDTYTYGESDACDFQYEVVTFHSVSRGSFEVNLNRTYNGNTVTEVSYAFMVDENYDIVETDLYAWVPDCITEYNAFETKYGTASIHDSYIAYCAEVNYSTGASLVMEQSGTAEIKTVLESPCSTVEACTAPGTPSYSVVVYQPVSDGTVALSWKVGREWDMENSMDSHIAQTYEISGGGTTITEVISDGYAMTLTCDMTRVSTTEQSPMASFYVDTDFEGDSITLLNGETDEPVGTLLDDGKYSVSYDDLPGDGVYSAKISLDNSEPKILSFYAKAEDESGIVSTSNVVEIQVYDELTDKDFADMQAVDEAIQKLKDDGGYQALSDGEKTQKLGDLLQKLAETGTEARSYSLIQPDSIALSQDGKSYSFQYACGVLCITDIGATEGSGDVNADGTLNAADLVMFQKWLLHVSDAKLTDWKAADFDRNNKLNGFDLTQMRLALLNPQDLLPPSQSEAQPALLIVNYDTGIDETGWITKTSAQVIDTAGTLYTRKYDENSLENGASIWDLTAEDWMGQTASIMENGTVTKNAADASLTSAINQLTANAGKYQDCAMEDWKFGIDDYGINYLYALYTDASGTTRLLELCRFGGMCTWLDDPDVQSLVTALIEADLFADQNWFHCYLENSIDVD